MTVSVIVYSQPSCMPCKATVRQLDRLGINHVVQNVQESPHAEQYVKDLGYNGTPVVVTSSGEHWQGHRPDRIGGLIA